MTTEYTFYQEGTDRVIFHKSKNGNKILLSIYENASISTYSIELDDAEDMKKLIDITQFFVDVVFENKKD